MCIPCHSSIATVPVDFASSGSSSWTLVVWNVLSEGLLRVYAHLGDSRPGMPNTDTWFRYLQRESPRRRGWRCTAMMWPKHELRNGKHIRYTKAIASYCLLNKRIYIQLISVWNKNSEYLYSPKCAVTFVLYWSSVAQTVITTAPIRFAPLCTPQANIYEAGWTRITQHDVSELLVHTY